MAHPASIVVPVFGTEDYLSRCLESLLNQTYQDFEIVVVDDCSKGDCQSIVASFLGRKSHLKYVRHPKNLGLMRARFTGADNSTGEYVGYLDSDDVALPNFVGSRLAAARASGADIVGSLLTPKESSDFTLKGADALLSAFADGTVDYSTCTKLYRKTLLGRLERLRQLAETHRLDVPEDLTLNVFCALEDTTYVNVPQRLLEIDRSRSDSLSNDLCSTAIRRNVESRALAYKFIAEAAREFQVPVEKLLKKSATVFYRKTLTRCSTEDLAWVKSYLRETPEGESFASLLLDVAAHEGKRLFHDLSETRRKLSDAKSELTETKARLKQKCADEKKLGAQLRAQTEKLEASGLLRIWRAWRYMASRLGFEKRDA